jgi:hypothetical protein
MNLPCIDCLTLPLCRSKYSHCKAIYCDIIKEYFSTGSSTTTSQRIFQFNNFLWNQQLADNYTTLLREKENGYNS